MSYQPIPLYPAYRSGASTPWGGDGLKIRFHKDIPDPRTGESLEMSVIPGLNSRDAKGNALEDLLAHDWVGMVGTGVEKPFPLLLKLIDARDRLSVQVHPDDAYAQRVENKLGKTEAWAILHHAGSAGRRRAKRRGHRRAASVCPCQIRRRLLYPRRYGACHRPGNPAL